MHTSSKPEEQLWMEVEERTCQPVPEPVREFCRLQGYVTSYQEATDATAQGELADQVADLIGNLRESGLLEAAAHRRYEPNEEILVLEPVGRRGLKDPRWSLWRDLLDASARGAQQGSDWAPIRIRQIVEFNERLVLPGRIEVSFDARLPMDTVTAELRSLWPELLKREWARRTRPLGDKRLALVRFLCLESDARATWQERLVAWNERYPPWSLADRRAMAAEFRKGSNQLTGQWYGLEWLLGLAEQLNLDAVVAEIEKIASGQTKTIKRSILPAVGAMTCGYYLWLGSENGQRVTRELKQGGLEKKEIETESFFAFLRETWLSGSLAGRIEMAWNKEDMSGQLGHELISAEGPVRVLQELRGAKKGGQHG